MTHTHEHNNMNWLHRLLGTRNAGLAVDQVDEATEEGAKRVYELALKQREFEISQLTQRNNFFMIFQGVLIAGLVQSQGTAAPLIYFMLCFTGMVISIFQIGMAGGAKYWQIRWEVAVKDLELHLLEALKDHPRRMHQLFTADAKHLDSEGRKRLEAINQSPARRHDPLKTKKGVVQGWVEKDLDGGRHRFFNRWMVHWAVKKKWSVSKIPLWVGFILFIFWAVLWANTVTICGRTVGELIEGAIQGVTGWIPSRTLGLRPFKNG